MKEQKPTVVLRENTTSWETGKSHAACVAYLPAPNMPPI